MSKSVRTQLADALQLIRDLKNAQHAAVQPLHERIAELENQNRRLSDELVHTHRRLYAIEVLANGIKDEVSSAAMAITDTRRWVASGKSVSDGPMNFIGGKVVD